jgi:hypothetical protein
LEILGKKHEYDEKCEERTLIKRIAVKFLARSRQFARKKQIIKPNIIV